MSDSDAGERIERKLTILLKERRMAQKLSQAKLAAKAKVSRSTITHLEDGSSHPTLRVLLQIAQALDLELWRELKEASESNEK